jgi:hypothetical protein
MRVRSFPLARRPSELDRRKADRIERRDRLLSIVGCQSSQIGSRSGCRLLHSPYYLTPVDEFGFYPLSFPLGIPPEIRARTPIFLAHLLPEPNRRGYHAESAEFDPRRRSAPVPALDSRTSSSFLISSSSLRSHRTLNEGNRGCHWVLCLSNECTGANTHGSGVATAPRPKMPRSAADQLVRRLSE